MENNKITIAIDGYSSCGKSTMAKALAKEIGYIFIDSGAMYRAIALYCLRNNLILPHEEPDIKLIVSALPKIEIHFQFDQTTKQADIYLNGENVSEEIRKPEVADVVSRIAAINEVRKKLVTEQRKMGEKGGIVMDGRDIGSVVFPNAELKFFVTASPEIRAERRWKELKAKGIETNLEDVLANLQERDHLDSTRKESPLIKVQDSIEIDTSDLTPEEQLKLVESYYQQKMKELAIQD